MEILEKLEHKIDGLMNRLRELEAENSRLQAELDDERANKQKIMEKLDNLLQKVQEMNID
jgi:cell division protein ZapB